MQAAALYSETEISASGNGPKRHSFNNAPAKRPFLEAGQDMAPKEFWQKYLLGCEETVFPQIPTTVKSVQRSEEVTYRASLNTSPTDTVSLIQTAWALLLGQYTESQDVVIATGTDLPGRPIEDPLIVPLRFKIRKEAAVRELSQQAEKFTCDLTASQELVDFCTCRLTDPFSNSLLLIQSAGQANGAPSRPIIPSNCALLLHCAVVGDEVHMSGMYDPHVVHREQTQRILNQLAHILHQLTDPGMRAGDVDFLSPQDRDDIARWNSGGGPPDTCIHTLIDHHVQTRPDAPAVCAHDGDFTFAELDAHATKLAHHLVALGIRPGAVVPTLFEKSKWTQVALLAILKAGAAFAMLDPAHPPSRNRQIATTVSARLALTSALHATTLGPAVPTTVALTASLLAHLPCPQTPIPPPAPSSPASILFTSGSTGRPKGAILPHAALAATGLSLARTTRLGPSTRVLQSASYAFGAAIVETVLALAAGATTCVPSDAARATDVAAYARAARVDWAFMVPSAARRVVAPADVPELRVLVTGGEVVAREVVARWGGAVELFGVYGSAEQSCITAIGGPLGRGGGEGVGLGMLKGCWAWIVGEEGGLVPVGAVGELVVEGKVVAEGYLGEVEKTKEAFPAGFAWRGGFKKHPDGRVRLYRTGDLVRYGPGGTIEFVGRRDGYVKLRGQRVELGEIEFQLKRIVETPLDLCVEVVVPKGASMDKAALVAFVSLGDGYEGEDDGVQVPKLCNRKRLATLLRDVE
ncbi:nonribosomal peptide [Diplodia corticola]|uniref:Nonribosomal peptide n=1 Tax=Diplodia corticola TaxID=236234 RepID=A0A1J9SB91_9PEZI|nr:nonribosomal peptide [Diplodia corticola]OJD36853.1 nonribosomal peptide [Diplodia corticola]